MEKVKTVQQLNKLNRQVGELIETAKYIINNEHEHEDAYYHEIMLELNSKILEMLKIISN